MTRPDRFNGDRTAYRSAAILALMTAALLVPIFTGTPARAAGPVFWDYPERQPFADLELQGAALDAHGRLVPGLAADEIIAGPPEVFWCAELGPDGAAYMGSGHGGEIWRIDGDKSRLHATVAGTEVFSLLRRDDGLLAGCGPGGELFHVARDGEVEAWGVVPEGYVWDLVATPSGRVYLAAGSPAVVYRVDGPDRLERLAELPATNALGLAVAGEDELLVATQGPGLVFRLRPGEDPELLFEAQQDEVRQVLRGPPVNGLPGDWHALALAAADDRANGPARNGDQDAMTNGFDFMDMQIVEKGPPRAALIRLGDDGLAETVWSGDVDLMIAATSDRWGWLAAGPRGSAEGHARLLALDPPSGTRPVATWEGGDVLDLLSVGDGEDEEILVCLAHPGQVVRLRPGRGQDCAALSPPLDANLAIAWARMSWRGEGDLRWSVRAGARSVPDATWTDWSDTWRDSDHVLDLPRRRFLQWRVEFADARRGDRLDAVSVSGFAPNLPPTITSLQLQADGAIQIGGLMRSSENLTETLGKGLRVEYSLPTRADRRATPARAAEIRPVRTFSWRADDPNGDRLVYRLEYRRVDEPGWRLVGDETREEIGSWDTRTVPDGRYVVRLSASDRPDNPSDRALETVRESAPLLVDHTPPRIGELKLRRTETGFGLRFDAEDEMSALAGARIELPDGRHERIDPVDLVCDSGREEFAVEVGFPRSDSGLVTEPWLVRVEVFDRQGNLAARDGLVR